MSPSLTQAASTGNILVPKSVQIRLQRMKQQNPPHSHHIVCQKNFGNDQGQEITKFEDTIRSSRTQDQVLTLRRRPQGHSIELSLHRTDFEPISNNPEAKEISN